MRGDPACGQSRRSRTTLAAPRRPLLLARSFSGSSSWAYSKCDRIQDRETLVKCGLTALEGPRALMVGGGGEPDQADRLAGDEVDAGVERVDLGPGDLHAEGALVERLAGAVGVVAEPKLQQLADLH